jgi:hypothetical protein
MPVYKSPTSLVRDIDIVTDTRKTPVGSPAVVIGSSRRGPAFVPITFGSYSDFASVFGATDAATFGPMALKRWMTSGQGAGTYVRLLGAGDCKKRVSSGQNSGKVNKAGFVVGAENVQINGLVSANIHAYDGGPPGQTYILGCFMSESLGSTIFYDAGIKAPHPDGSHPIIRAVLMAASGVRLSLNSSATANNTPTAAVPSGFFGKKAVSGDAGLSYGDILLGQGHEQKITVILNGFIPNGDHTSAITASLINTTQDAAGTTVHSLAEAFNTNPFKLEEAGHLLKLHYDVSEQFAVPTGSQITSHVDTNDDEEHTDVPRLYQTAFLLSSSLLRNSGSTSTKTSLGTPNLENFENRYTHASSPTVISQMIGGKNHDLFKVHARDDGANIPYKITIDEIYPSDNDQNAYGTFNLYVRRIEQPETDFGSTENDENIGTLETFRRVNLNPRSNDYILKRVGDQHHFYDFDKKDEIGQKIVTLGDYIGVSSLIRIEMSKQFEDRDVPSTVLPTGFRGIKHYVTSGSTSAGSTLTGSGDTIAGSGGTLATHHGIVPDLVARVVQPPLPFRERIGEKDGDAPHVYKINNTLTWGFQTENKDTPLNPNFLGTFNSSSLSFTEYMPDFHTKYQNFWVGDNHGTPDVAGCIFDADRFNNNLFTLERIEVITSSNNLPDPNQWEAALYRRPGKAMGTLYNKSGVPKESRFLKFSDFHHQETQKFLGFTFPMLGGFDGLNIFDKDKSLFRDAAVTRELSDPKQGLKQGPTVSSYRKSIDIFEDKTREGSVLAIPGLRNNIMTNHALMMAEERFDMFYIMDIEERDELNNLITSSLETRPISLKNTVSSFLNDPKDSSFGAVYFPDIKVNDASFLKAVYMPPSVAVLGTYGSLSNDFVKPLGLTSGQVAAQQTQQIFDDDDQMIDLFFQSGINIIQKDATIDSGGPFIRSQMTLKHGHGAMTRIGTRRMLLMVRREVKKALIATALFESSTRVLRISTKATLKDLLSTLQSSGAFRLYKLEVLDSKQDAESNKLSIKILIRPNNSSEMLAIDEDGATPLSKKYF